MKKNDPNEKLPLLKTWGQWYALVIGFLIVLIILFYFITKSFA